MQEEIEIMFYLFDNRMKKSIHPFFITVCPALRGAEAYPSYVRVRAGYTWDKSTVYRRTNTPSNPFMRNTAQRHKILSVI